MALAVISLVQTLEPLLYTLNTDFHIPKLVKKFQTKLCVLRDFLQNSSGHGNNLKALETNIINVACKADDIIRRNVLDKGFTSRFPDELKELMAEIDSVVKEVTEFENKGKRVAVRIEQGRILPYRDSFPTTVVGLEDDFRMITDRLMNSKDLQVLSIVGMGGIGKTTLAKSVYRDTSVAQHFDRCAWVTVSQEFQELQVYLGILRCFGFQTGELDQKRNDQLEEQVYKSLKGTRYLIVLDDVWNTTTWDHLRRLFPNDGTGSRILLTTRIVEVALYASSGKPPHKMCFLSEEKGWELFSAKVFGKECYPSELEKIGKQIVFKCGGLPLAILVVAGLLSKVNKTTDEWKNVLENLNALVSTNDDENCFGILRLSYHQLDIHLKCCFVYMAVFPEDAVVPVPKLIKLWIAEGFVEGACYEETAEAYLEELIDRSLVLISKRGSDGKAKTCIVHDLLRELCLREANTQKFMLQIKSCDTDLPAAHINFHCRFIFQTMKWKQMEKFLKTSIPSTCRSILSLDISSFLHWKVEHNFWRFKFLRVLDTSSVSFTYSLLKYDYLLYLRYIAVSIVKDSADSFFSIEQFGFLQTFLVHDRHPTSRKFLRIVCEMKELRHLQLGSCGMICFSHNSGMNKVLLPNLQTLSRLCPSSCCLELFENFPNLKKLGITYYYAIRGRPNCLASVRVLHNLEALKFQYMGNLSCGLAISRKLNLQPDIFPLNLKKLSLLKSCLPWKDMSILVRLPNLEVLKLKKHAFVGPGLETEDGFQALKVLVLDSLDLVHWKTSSDHFPMLQRLVIRHCNHLEGIPPEIGDILTLQELEMDCSNHSVMNCAQEILEQQQNWGNDEFHVHFNSTPRFSK